MRWPSSTPAGMRTLTCRGRRSTPLPLHVGHGDSTIVPRPLHRGQARLKENGPWFSSTAPRPPHVGHTTGVVPGAAPLPWQVWHAISLVRLTVVVTPLTASRNERCSSVSRSSPRRGPTVCPRRRPPPPPPKRLPNRSPRPPTSPRSSVVKVKPPPPGAPPPKPAPPGPKPPAIGPRRRTSSYALR